MVALIQSENHSANKGKIAGRYQFDTHPTGIGLNILVWYVPEISVRHSEFRAADNKSVFIK